jgi:hypothetical protein
MRRALLVVGAAAGRVPGSRVLAIRWAGLDRKAARALGVTVRRLLLLRAERLID